MGLIKLHHPPCFVLFGSALQNAVCSFLICSWFIFALLSHYIPLWEGKVQVKCVYSFSPPPLGFLVFNHEVDGGLILHQATKITLQFLCHFLDNIHIALGKHSLVFGYCRDEDIKNKRHVSCLKFILKLSHIFFLF